MFRLRTLIVDDSDEFLAAAAAIVREDENCELCGVARSGGEALELAWRQMPDLILLDVNLGDMSGFLAASALRAALPGCRVLMMSLHDSPTYRSRSREIGAVAFLAKSELFDRFAATAEALRLPPPPLRAGDGR